MGTLTVSPDAKTAECPFCGAVYDLRENSQVVKQVNHLHADMVNINNDQSAEARLKAADAFLKLKNYSEAEKNYWRVVQLTPQDYRGWWGCIVSWTQDFTRRERSESQIKKYLEDCAKSVEAFAPVDISRNLLGRYQNYIASQRQLNESEKESIQTRIDQINQELKEVESEENVLLTQQSNINTNVQKEKGSGAVPFFCVAACMAILGSVFIVLFLSHFDIDYLVAAIICYGVLAALIKGKNIVQENKRRQQIENARQQIENARLQIGYRLRELRMRKNELESELREKENEMRGYL